MLRRSSLTACAIAAMTVSFVAGAAIVPSRATPTPERKADDAKPPVVIGHKTAVFNMAGVMRDFNQAKYRVWALNNRKTELSQEMLTWRNEYTKIQAELKDMPDDPKKEQKVKRMLTLTRQIEDEDKEINKKLNDEASAIIANLYDMIKAAVDKTAERDGFQLVLAYPDAVTPEEQNSPYIKELKLKPPAAQPFHVAPEVDITARVIKMLNEKHPPIDPKTKKPVDVTTLPPPPPSVPGPVIPAGGMRP